MKQLLLFIAILSASCGSNPKNYQKAENALDAGREFIGACLQGDFPKAAYLLLPTEANQEKLKETEAYYRQKDKEGRQQYRAASININEVTELNADTTIIRYSNSFDKTPETLRVIRQKDGWFVDLTTDKSNP